MLVAGARDGLTLVNKPADSIVVCIPTYRRPAQLAALLRALVAQRETVDFDILVGNNEDADVRRYPELADPSLPRFDVLAVSTRGVSAVRNAMIAHVLAQPNPPRWVACIDDDQCPNGPWLANLVETGTLYDADLVGGPVGRVVRRTTFWSDAASDTSYLPRKTGPTTMLNEAGNLLIASRWLRALDRAPFSLSFGLTGGEDYEFFLLARSRHARMVWANEARVEEALRNDQLTFAGYVSRYYTIAAYQARADRVHRGTAYAIAQVARNAGKGAVATVAALFRDHSAKRAALQAIRFGAVVAGRVAGLFGARAEKYGRD